MTRAPGRLARRIAAAARNSADRAAITFLDDQLAPRTYTFGELIAAATQIADRLASTGVDRSLPLGILLRTHEEQVLHYLGALFAGAVPAILAPPNRKLNREYYTETMAAVLEQSGFSAVITDLDEIAAGYPSMTPWSLQQRDGQALRSDSGTSVDPNVSFMQFSSGTTGIKRGVLVTDEAVLAQLESYAAALRLSQDDVIVSWLPLYHDMGFIACLNLPLAFGVHTVMLDPVDWVTDPSRFLLAATRYGATLSWNPNFAYAFMGQRVPEARLSGVDLSSVRGLVNCSEPVTEESQRMFADRFAAYGLAGDAFVGCYAMAETVFALTHGDRRDPDHLDWTGPVEDARREGSRAYVSVGRPLAGVDLRVFADDGDELGDRRIGELWVRSPFNLSGYYRNPEATTAAFQGEWYRTGDLGYRVGDAFYVVGRKKDVLIVGGVNVFPQDLEDLVSELKGVKPGRVSAFGQFDPRQQTDRVVVLAESELEGEEARQAVLGIRQRVQAAFHITGFKVHLVPAGWLVKSTAGKMARGANREKWEAQQDRLRQADSTRA